ncbi:MULTISPECIES: response regulator [unclassified Streptomyces]|uniref:response regulator n=1 Tax=unclassified Streptomyces TaxID=2593676 RepID=UPI000747D136|nr:MULTISPECIES: response regulator transcription factor [unclassified Streptomyces]KUL49709.1 LuxR family transcriptional regulator [Streptomyces sp. NRRL S-1521]THC43432.1 response regulator transcription factor [Streptomyces sp. A1499]
MPPISVLLADDQPMIRTGFRYILEAEPDIEVVGEAADGREAVEEARRLSPDIVLMDIRMPQADGVEATRLIVESGLPARVIILTTFDLDQHVVDALRAGASSFLVKDGPADSLVAAIRTVADGEAVLAPRVTRRLLDRFAGMPWETAPPVPPRLDVLTGRELDVLRTLARGLSNAEIAAELRIGETTVKTHIAHILEKFHLRDRVQAVILAYDSGLVGPPHTGHRPAW